ncbi:MAG: MBL fold metallo-hydrolase [Zunongwangia sp.]|jgi:glyoxylase-like metal-dependent hydrolase (beta-lactamase superfamily II)/rhodanese-related sulfurtransferase|uniref:MBL fold metallo-hydrolase n=1 Tax=Zunongwangia profunda TaxID=398743 RepID=A0A3D5J5C6_9FLAO|nr:MBL fold metallo-hydrolase [Zunongwangia profunda]MAG86526.1 MBL fold metallo-hydrolase [Flavobacteriaceae bacterium]MAO38593.1 MBL fold metallo-hydrolase [Zunongwangia sp.]MCC4230739.1 MBL fold metallo-hydrolase [Zunongwangia profunda]HAJ81104.1 MBL fold metallo-hydrolase [Zunongwangia profunda]HCV83174.1 MBL fold metallo-hydrolase [Zunongwangia profunda]|tara:strand:+ start:4960 stop:6372 length:1413 start_codon:yes stop_codon:yes gene_type:complete
MKVEQIYTGCLAHAAYYIESKGEAAIFDPLREVNPYIQKAENDHAKIKYVFETHFHADFVSGHLDLQKKTGAKIVFGPNAKPGYEALVAEDGQIFKIGDYKVKVIHTPGHTMESTTYLLIDDKGNEHGIITGDTLFIGDVGRPDLAQHVISDLTEDKLAGYLFDSLRHKIMPLDDDLMVYPNHGAGSACGKKMSKETTDTLGNQKKTNYALRADMTKKEFIKELLTGLTAPPNYFPKNVLLNIGGYKSFDKIMKQAAKALTPDEFELLANEEGALVLDTREADNYAKSHIPNSINIGLQGSFAPWVGEMIPDLETPILLITEVGKEEEAITRLSRVGYDNTQGYLADGMKSWEAAGKEVDTINRITAEELEQKMNQDIVIIDVRKKSEFDSEHIEGVVNVPLNQINQHLEKFPKEQEFVLHCAGGYRSMIAASILQQRGWSQLTDVIGGFKSIKETTIPVTAYVCPSTLL